jgi:hypothetical protein
MVMDVLDCMSERTSGDIVILTSGSSSIVVRFQNEAEADQFVIELDASAGRRAPVPPWLRDEVELEEALGPSLLVTGRG